MKQWNIVLEANLHLDKQIIHYHSVAFMQFYCIKHKAS